MKSKFLVIRYTAKAHILGVSIEQSRAFTVFFFQFAFLFLLLLFSIRSVFFSSKRRRRASPNGASDDWQLLARPIFLG